MTAKLTQQQFEARLRNSGYTLLGPNFQGLRATYRVKCQQGHVHRAQGQTLTSYGCPECAQIKAAKPRISLNRITKELRKEWYSLDPSTPYVNTQQTVILRCSNDHQWYTTIKNFRAGRRCPECRLQVKPNSQG